jgi:hypothetical protein
MAGRFVKGDCMTGRSQSVKGDSIASKSVKGR